jgi:uncharacterized membrane protein
MDGRGVLLAVTTVLTGLLAGLYYAFAVSVMPGLGGTSDAVFAAAMNQINVAIQNPAFFLTFMGAPLLTVIAVIVCRRGSKARTRWLIGAAALNVLSIAITISLNIPLNDALARDRDVGAFEGAWVTWNTVRTLVTTGAFVAMVGALLVRPGGARGEGRG